MYNQLLRQHLVTAQAEFDMLQGQLTAMSGEHQGSWRDCSETTLEEIEQIQGAINAVQKLTTLVIDVYFIPQ